MSEVDYAERVQRGIALMDKRWPGWAQGVDLEKLDIQDGAACMTAQYSAAHGGAQWWDDGRFMLELTVQEYEDHGFNGVELEYENGDSGVPDSAYDALNALWRSEIERRRAAAQPEVSER